MHRNQTFTMIIQYSLSNSLGAPCALSINNRVEIEEITPVFSVELTHSVSSIFWHFNNLASNFKRYIDTETGVWKS